MVLSAALVCLLSCGNDVAAEDLTTSALNSPVVADNSIVSTDANTKRFLKHWYGEDFQLPGFGSDDGKEEIGNAEDDPTSPGSLPDAKKTRASATDDSSDISAGSRHAHDKTDKNPIFQAFYHHQNYDKMYNKEVTIEESAAELGLRCDNTVFYLLKSLKQKRYEAHVHSECALSKFKAHPVCPYVLVVVCCKAKSWYCTCPCATFL